jgi:hypothetical protein
MLAYNRSFVGLTLGAGPAAGAPLAESQDLYYEDFTNNLLKLRAVRRRAAKAPAPALPMADTNSMLAHVVSTGDGAYSSDGDESSDAGSSDAGGHYDSAVEYHEAGATDDDMTESDSDGAIGGAPDSDDEIVEWHGGAETDGEMAEPSAEGATYGYVTIPAGPAAPPLSSILEFVSPAPPAPP